MTAYTSPIIDVHSNRAFSETDTSSFSETYWRKQNMGPNLRAMLKQWRNRMDEQSLPAFGNFTIIFIKLVQPQASLAINNLELHCLYLLEKIQRERTREYMYLRQSASHIMAPFIISLKEVSKSNQKASPGNLQKHKGLAMVCWSWLT